MPGLDDVASLALRRAWEALDSGTASVNLRDLAALLRLACEARDKRPPGHPDEQWRAAVREILWTARSHLRDGWPAFASDLRSNETLRDL